MRGAWSDADSCHAIVVRKPTGAERSRCTFLPPSNMSRQTWTRSSRGDRCGKAMAAEGRAKFAWNWRASFGCFLGLPWISVDLRVG